MIKPWRIIGITCIMLGAVSVGNVQSASSSPIEVSIKYKEGYNFKNLDIVSDLRGISTVVANVTPQELRTLRLNKDVETIEPRHTYNNLPLGDVVATVDGTDTDSSIFAGFETGWNINYMQAPVAWSDGYTGKGVKVGIVDSGIDTHHPDLKVEGGMSALNGEDSYEDDLGHGTHVAGIVAALHNDKGVVGVAPDAQLYAIKVINKERIAYDTDIAEGIYWAVQNKMDIINLSLGTPDYSQIMDSAIRYALRNGIIVIASSGNLTRSTYEKDGHKYFVDDDALADYYAPTENVSYPAKFDGVTAVTAVNKFLEIAEFSSRGESTDYAAPGVAVYSTYKDQSYTFMNGTSMAAPHITGMYAILKQEYPDLSATDLEGKMHELLTNSIDVGGGHSNLYGYGFVAYTNDTLHTMVENINGYFDVLDSKATIKNFANLGWLIESMPNGIEKETQRKKMEIVREGLDYVDLGSMSVESDQQKAYIDLLPYIRATKTPLGKLPESFTINQNGTQVNFTPELRTTNYVVINLSQVELEEDDVLDMYFKIDDKIVHERIRIYQPYGK